VNDLPCCSADGNDEENLQIRSVVKPKRVVESRKKEKKRTRNISGKGNVIKHSIFMQGEMEDNADARSYQFYKKSTAEYEKIQLKETKHGSLGLPIINEFGLAWPNGLGCQAA
jgi:hypothetical protein